MNRYIKGLYMSFSMFCAVPLPLKIWDEKSMNLVLPCFPLVGGFIGLLWWGIFKIFASSGIHIMLASALLTLVPFILSGFLHLDGFMDTSDAVLSRRPIEDKLRILKDPHPGSFAVIMLAALFVLQFAAMFIITEKNNAPELLIIIPIISRCCSAMSVCCLKTMDQSGLAKTFRQNTGARHKIFLVFIAAAAAALSYLFCGIAGFAVSAALIAGFTGALTYTYKDLKGVSGDLAGHALVTGELCALVVMAII